MSWIRKAGDGTEPNSELDAGIEVEKEHAGTIKWLVEKLGGKVDDALNKEAFKRIAQDHLNELPDYYTRLEAMEKAGKRKEGTDKFHDNLQEKLGQK